MDRGAWQVLVHKKAKSGHDWMTKHTHISSSNLSCCLTPLPKKQKFTCTVRNLPVNLLANLWFHRNGLFSCEIIMERD